MCPTAKNLATVLSPSRIFGDAVTGQDCGDEVALWLSGVLKRDVRLLYHDAEASQRRIPEFKIPLPLVDRDRDGVSSLLFLPPTDSFPIFGNFIFELHQ